MFEQLISSIRPLDEVAMAKCQVRLDNLTKPLGSLHSFEHLARKMAGISGMARPRTLSPRIVLMNGSERTKGLLDVFAEHVSAEIVLFDVQGEARPDKDQVKSIMEKGAKIACFSTGSGLRVIGIGRVGEEVTPAIFETLRSGYCAEGSDPIDTLTAAGSAELAGMVGVILGAASEGAVVVLDGAAAVWAALIAVRMAPLVKDYLVGSHYAAEQAQEEALGFLDLPAYLHLDMNVGEGVGAALGISLLQASLHVLNDMKTFGEAEVPVAEDGPGALVQNREVRD